MENDTDQEPCCSNPSTSAIQGKTFVITPDKIARLGLIEQIKSVFKSQVAPKISKSCTLQQKNNENKPTNLHKKENSTDSLNLLSVERADNEVVTFADADMTGNNNTGNEQNTVLDKSFSTSKIINKIRAKTIQRKNSIKRVKHSNIESVADEPNDSSPSVSSVSTTKGHDIKDEHLSSDKVDERTDDGLVSEAEFLQTEIRQSHIVKPNITLNSNGWKKDAINKLSSSYELADKTFLEGSADVIDDKDTENKNQDTNSSILTIKSNDSMSMEILDATAHKALSLLVNLKNYGNENINADSTNVNKIKTFHSPTSETSFNKIRVLKVEPVFLPEMDLKRISQSVVRDRNISTLSPTSDSHIIKVTQASPHPRIEDSQIIQVTEVPANPLSVLSIEDITPSDFVIPTKPQIRRRTRKKRVMHEIVEVDDEPEKAEEVLILETKRTRRKKVETEFITDEEYESAMEMAGPIVHSKVRLPTPTKKRKRKPTPKIINQKSTEHTSDNLSEQHLNLPAITELLETRKLKTVTECNTTDDLSVQQISQASISKLETDVKDEFEEFQGVDESQSMVQMNVQNCITSLDSFLAPHESLCESVFITNLSNNTAKSLTETAPIHQA